VRNIVTEQACPRCGRHRWWTTFMAGKFIILFGGGGEAAYSECHHCGHQERITRDPPPWPTGTTFPHPDPPED
jgi:hypothetical protein